MCGSDFEPDSLGLRVRDGKLELVRCEVWGLGIDQCEVQVIDSVPCSDIIKGVHYG